MRKNRQKIMMRRRIAVVALLSIIIVVITLFAVNKNVITFSSDIEESINVEYGSNYVPARLSAKYTGSIFKIFKKDADVSVINKVDTMSLGDYTVYYVATYEDKTEICTQTVHVVDTTAPKIMLNGGDVTYVSPGYTYVEPGFSAYDEYDGDVTKNVKVVSAEDKIIYEVTDSNGNTATATRTIKHEDKTRPEIALTSGETYVTGLNAEYVEPGYTATDDVDGDITANVTVSGTVNTSVKGDYVLTYTVSDSNKNTATATRTVTVKDLTAPVITLNGASKVYIKVGETYTDAGATAVDSIDGETKVTVSGSVDTGTMGVYTLTYTSVDGDANTSTATRTVYVYEKASDFTAVNPGSKVIYLTFDDGPGPYTQKLLDILDKYNVKVTFFVTNQSPNYQSLIAAEAAAGHTVALHTYSHRYNEIYVSEAAFYADLKKINDIVKAQTGTSATIIRFPGGSSNMVSADYCKGIMTALTGSIGNMGYLYCDWNVSSGDAGGARTAEAVAQNVIRGCSSHDVSVVLQHDIKEFSVDAVEEIIVWGLANGYTFLPLTETSPMVHHGVNN